MSTMLRRSCDACVRAKRRCNLSTPRCSRCSTKNLDCTYVNQPAPAPSNRSRECKETTQKDRSFYIARDPLTPSKLALKHGPVLGPRPHIPEVVRLFTPITLWQQLRILQTFVVHFAHRGAVPFLHPCLYDTHLPEPLQHASRICAIYGLGEGPSARLDPEVIRTETNQMLRLAETATSFPELVAHVQAIAFVQIIRLFQDTDSLEESGCDDKTFWELAQLLWIQAPVLLPRVLSPWRAWLFAESVRRTILVCHIILAVRGVLRRGYAVHLLCVEALPFDMRAKLWDADSADGWEAAAAGARGPSLVSMRQFAALKQPGQSASAFEDLLLLSFKDDFIRKL